MALLDLVADNATSICTAELTEVQFGSGFGAVTDIENGPDGRLYIVSLTLGTVYRVGPRPGFNPDADGDGVADACDCASSDAGAYAVPVEIPRVRATSVVPTTMRWDPQTATAGTGTTYTVVSGDARALRPDGGFASACTLSRGFTGPELTETRPDPPAGSAYYYLPRAETRCGAGTFGDGSVVPDPRDLIDAALPADCPTAPSTGGAIVSFRIVNESLATWVTDDSFIDRAKQHLANGTHQVPIFNKLLDGRSIDPQWSWHVDPQDVSFADAAIELCDGLPSHIEANKTYWLQTVGSYCPWSATVTAIDDRR